MWHREWKCICPKETETGFIEYLHKTGVSDTQNIKGCISYEILRRNLENELEITLITKWSDFDSIKEYSDENIYRAVLYPDDHLYRIRPDIEVKIYEKIV